MSITLVLGVGNRCAVMTPPAYWQQTRCAPQSCQASLLSRRLSSIQRSLMRGRT